MAYMLGRWWRYFVSVIAISLIIVYVGPSSLLSVLRRADVVLLIAFFFGLLPIPLLFGLELHIGMRIVGWNLQMRTSLPAAVNAWSIGALTPGRAGDLTFAHFLGERLRRAEVAAVVLADKIVSLFVLVVLGALSACWIDVPFAQLLYVGAGFTVVASLGLIVGFGTRRGTGIAASLPVATVSALAALLGRPSFLLWTCMAVGFRWVYIAALNVMLFQAVSARVGFLYVLTATAVGRVISLVPVSISGVGLTEPAQIAIYSTTGIEASQVVAVSVIGTALLLMFAAVCPHLTAALVPQVADSEVGE